MGENGKRLAEAMALVSRGDVEGFGDVLLADDVVWHWPGASSVSGDYHGRSAVLELLKGFHALTQNRLSVVPLDMLEGEDHLMSFTRVTAESEGGSEATTPLSRCCPGSCGLRIIPKGFRPAAQGCPGRDNPGSRVEFP